MSQTQLYSKIEGNGVLTNKANLVTTMQEYYMQQQCKPPCIIPETYKLTSSEEMTHEIKNVSQVCAST